MYFRKILLRVMLISLALAAVVGALAILVAAEHIIWRVVWTAICTAGAAALLMGFSLMADREKSRAAGLFGMTAVVVEFLLAIGLIWELFDLLIPGYGYGRIGDAPFIMLAWNIPATFVGIFLLRVRHLPAARLAANAGLVIYGITWLLFVVPPWTTKSWGLIIEHLWASAAALAGFGLLAFCCLVNSGSRRYWRHLGLLASALGLAMAIFAIWKDLHEGSPIFTGIVCLAAIIAHANLVMLCPLQPWQTWVRVIAIVCATTAGVLITWNDTLELRRQDDILLRSAGALGFVAGCATLALLIFAKLNQRISQKPVLSEIRQLTLICPGCQKKQSLPVGDSQCPTCRLRFEVKIVEPRCPNCDYLLFMLTSDRCPECGTPVESRGMSDG